MKAVQLIDYTDKEPLNTMDVPDPELKSGELLVDVYSAAVNPFDIRLASGMYKEFTPLKFPYIPGSDFAGKIVKVGDGVTDLKEGMEVYGSASVLSGGTGAYAQKLTTRTDLISLKPQSISFDEAAGSVLTGVSAYQALVENINLQNEQKILIHGGAGGIGHIAVQMAVAMGAHVSTTVSGDDMDFVKGLGATGVINYKEQDFETILKEYDAVFDTVGGETTAKSISVLRTGGILVTMVGDVPEELYKEKDINFIKQNTKVNRVRMLKLTEYLADGKVKVNIDKVFPLEKTADAFSYKTENSVKGKVVIRVKI